MRGTVAKKLKRLSDQLGPQDDAKAKKKLYKRLKRMHTRTPHTQK